MSFSKHSKPALPAKETAITLHLDLEETLQVKMSKALGITRQSLVVLEQAETGMEQTACTRT